jgi:hypothetical protein
MFGYHMSITCRPSPQLVRRIKCEHHHDLLQDHRYPNDADNNKVGPMVLSVGIETLVESGRIPHIPLSQSAVPVEARMYSANTNHGISMGDARAAMREAVSPNAGCAPAPPSHALSSRSQDPLSVV